MSKEKENKQDNMKEALMGCYGSQVPPSVVKQWLVNNILDNIDRDVKITLNIFGLPGTAKTSLVKSLENHPVEYKGKKYDGFQIIDIPLAQIEEMGDILGMPETFVEMEREVPDK